MPNLIFGSRVRFTSTQTEYEGIYVGTLVINLSEVAIAVASYLT